MQTSFVDCSLRAQVVSNDLSRGLFPARDLRLLVVDEAHRAQGDYAYCHVVRELTREGRNYINVAHISKTDRFIWSEVGDENLQQVHWHKWWSFGSSWSS